MESGEFMGYKVSWLLENRIMLIAYDGLLTRAELQTYLAETMDMRDRANAVLGEGGPLVHTITDARRMTKTELSLPEALKTVKMVRDQRVGWAIYIPAGKLDLFFSSLGHQIARVRFRSFPTIGEGVEFLKKMDDTLGDFTYAPDSAVTLSKRG